MTDLEAHIAHYVGPIDVVFHELVSEVVHVDVYHVPPDETRPYHTLVTGGMSALPMNTRLSDYAYAELVMCLPPEWDLFGPAATDEVCFWPVRWLRFLARFPHQYNTWLSYAHSILNGDPAAPFASDTRLSNVLLLPPVLPDKEFAAAKIGGRTIRFLAFIPLYQEEMDFKLQNGLSALIALLDQHNVTELLDPRRPCMLD